ncbi:MAG: amino acid ABC transporter permease, partial [Paracoccaceae bacterium]
METAFVRSNMLQPEPPPLKEQGAVKWLRENLFSGWLNSILTILGVLAIFWLIKASLPWLMHSVWNANSLTECRQVITSTWGPDATGACWAIIRERWHQFLFGFYPQDIYWRPVMSFFLLFAAITPVLFFGNRRTMLRVLGGMAVLMIISLLLLTGAKGQVTALQILFAVVVSAILLAAAYFKPSYLLWFTALYPPMTFWFLWGGSVWGP